MSNGRQHICHSGSPAEGTTIRNPFRFAVLAAKAASRRGAGNAEKNYLLATHSLLSTVASAKVDGERWSFRKSYDRSIPYSPSPRRAVRQAHHLELSRKAEACGVTGFGHRDRQRLAQNRFRISSKYHLLSKNR